MPPALPKSTVGGQRAQSIKFPGGLQQTLPMPEDSDDAWKKQLIEQATRAFDPGASLDAEERTQRTIDELYAKIGQLTVERDFLSKRSGR